MTLKLSKFLLVTLFSFFISSNLTYAASCDDDVNEMYVQIAKYASITSVDKHQFNDIYLPHEQDNNCYAEGYHSFGGRFVPTHICPVKWMKGNWGNTLTCL